MAQDMRELGSSGLKQSGGFVVEEFIKEWQGQRRYQTIAEMQQDAVIGGVLLTIILSLRQVPVEVKPADDTPQAGEVKDFVTECIGDMSSPWADTLSEILTMLANGWELNEICYKRRMGPQRDTGKSSKYTDGKIGWRKWAIRSQDSLHRWEFDEEGGLAGMWQYQWYQPGAASTVFIPIEKSLLFRAGNHKNNPEGQSVLRSAFVSYYYKKNLSRIEAIGLERGTGGIPIAYVPPNILSKNATSDEQALYATIKEIVTNVRMDEQAGIVFPLVYDESGNKLYDFQLLTTDKAGGVNTDIAISRYNQQITMSMLADFIMLGHEAVGSYALSATKASLFKTALEAWLQAIADVVNTHAIPRLMRLNGIAMELAPKLAFGKVGEIELLDVTTFITAAAGAGMTLFPDFELENHLRSVLGFPMLDEDEFAKREEEKKAAAADQVAIQREAINARSQGNQQQGGQQGAKMSRKEVISHLVAADMTIATGQDWDA